MANRPGDYFGTASPKTVLNRPFFHAQDQKAYNVDGGTSVADAWTTRDLNTVIHNDISGASLSGNAVTLPAGTYYVEGRGSLFLYSVGALVVGLHGIFVGGSVVLQGLSNSHYSGGNEYSGTTLPVSGVITLAEPAQVYLKYYVGLGYSAQGLGVPNSAGSIADTTIPSIYADLKIWQLDRSLEIAPVAVNTGLQTVPSLDTTGNIMGFDISKTGANELTITKGSCLDSTLLVPLAFTADVTLTIPSVANTIYHIFAVLTTGDVYEARAYTSEAAVLSDGTVDKFRWIGFWRTNGSSECVVGLQKDGIMYFGKASENVVQTNVSTTYGTISFSALVPESRVLEMLHGVIYSADGWPIMISLDGTNTYALTPTSAVSSATDTGQNAWRQALGASDGFVLFSTALQYKGEISGITLLCHAVKLRR